MVAIEKIRKAGLLVGSAFLLAGCDKFLEPEPADDFFSPDKGGDPALFQHIFWFFGHPEIYLPFVIIALGLSILAFAKFFPVKWKAIVRAMKWPPSVPALWIYGGAVMAILGILAGQMMARKGVDVALHDSYYLVVHAQFVGSVVIVSGMAAIIFFALPHILRANYNIWLGRLCWALWFAGISLIMFPQFYLSNQGMPRRYVDYEESYTALNDIGFFGAILCALALATFVVLVIEALVKRRPLRDKPANPTLDALE